MKTIIVGERTVLRTIRDDELELIRRWRNIPENRRMFFTDHDISPEEHRNWFDKIAADEARGTYCIAEARDDRCVGNITYEIEEPGEVALLGIMIGPEDDRGKGYGAEAIALLSEELAASRDVSKVAVEVFSTNRDALVFYRKIGFTIVRVEPERNMQDGKPCDVNILEKKLTSQ